MVLEKYLEEPLLVGFNESVSRAASLMLSASRREAAVMDGENFEGMLYARSIAKRNIQNPDVMKISGFVRRISPIKADASLEDALNYLMINNLRAAPVISKEGRILFINRRGLLDAFRKDAALKGKSAGDVMTFPYCISPEESVDVAKGMFRDLDVSCLPVVEGTKTVGLIDEMTLLRFSVKPQEREAGIDRIHPNIEVKSVMNKDVRTVKPDDSLPDVVDIMVREDRPTVIVESDGKISGIITRKDVLKHVTREARGVYVSVMGIKDEDAFIKSFVDKEIERFVKKIGKIIPQMEHVILHVDRYKESGTRIKYSVKGRVVTGKGIFFADSSEWDLTKAVGEVLDVLEREIVKKKEREKGFP